MTSRIGIVAWVAIGLSTSLALAEQTAKLPDGRSVLLKDDGTYQILPKQESVPGKAAGRTYNPIDMPDLKVDLKQILGQNIRTNAVATMLGDMVILSDPAVTLDMNGIMMDTKELPRESRRWLVRRDNQDETGATIRMRLAPGVS